MLISVSDSLFCIIRVKTFSVADGVIQEWKRGSIIIETRCEFRKHTQHFFAKMNSTLILSNE